MRRRSLLSLAAMALAAGCADLGVDLGGEQVAGMEIADGQGNTLVTVSGGSVNGTITVPRNGSRTLQIRLRNAAGGTIGLGIAESVRVTVVNSALVSWQESGVTTGSLSAGSATGSTSLRVDLIAAGIAEYTSPSITVTVT